MGTVHGPRIAARSYDHHGSRRYLLSLRGALQVRARTSCCFRMAAIFSRMAGCTNPGFWPALVAFTTYWERGAARKLQLAIGMCCIAAVALFLGGLLYNSTSLTTEALHLVGDALSYIISLLALCVFVAAGCSVALPSDRARGWQASRWT